MKSKIRLNRGGGALTRAPQQQRYLIFNEGVVYEFTSGGGGGGGGITGYIEDVTVTFYRNQNTHYYPNYIIIPGSEYGQYLINVGRGPGGGSSSPGNPPPTPNPLTVQAPNSYCAQLSMAAALQAKYGINADEALDIVAAALLNDGIYPYPGVNPPSGISMSISAQIAILESLGFTTKGTGSANPTRGSINTNFANGGWAIGTILPGANGGLSILHQIFLMGYDPITQSFSYYDGTETPGYQVGTIPASSVVVFLIK